MNDHHDILDPDSPWRADVRRNAAAKDQDLIDEADRLGRTPDGLLQSEWAKALIDFEGRTDTFIREQREAQR